jgi:Tol biopolymer transport system component
VFSPDGRWVAYGVNGSVFVQPYPPTGAKYQVPSTSSSSHHPFWSRDGKELFYEPSINQLFIVPVQTRPEFAFGPPVALPAGNFGSTSPAFARNRDVDATGKRFITPVLANDAATGSAFAEIRIVLNWFEELKQRVPTK